MSKMAGKNAAVKSNEDENSSDNDSDDDEADDIVGPLPPKDAQSDEQNTKYAYLLRV